MTELALWAEQAVLPSGLHAGARVRVSQGRISSVEVGVDPEGEDLELHEAILAPGLVDLQANGGDGAAYDDPDPEARARATRFHLASGSTSLLATLVSAPISELELALDRLRGDVCEEGPVVGVHLEGPFLAPEKKGAHRAEHLCEPRREWVERLLARAEGSLRLLTLAPELPEALEAIALLVRSNVRVAAGHSAATLAQVREAIDRGLSFVTHVGNASDWPSRPFDPSCGYRRSEPGLIGAFLCEPRLQGSVILDGHHLHPELVRALVVLRGPAAIALVSDSTPAAGLGPGRYPMGGLEAEVHPEGYATCAGGLAGAVVPLCHALRIAVERAGIPLETAVRMASATPADLLGLGHRKGRIRVGSDADLLALHPDLTPRAVFLRGRPIAA